MAQDSKQEPALKVTYSQGCLLIKGSKIDQIAEECIKSAQIAMHFIRNRKKRDGPLFHLTLLTQEEIKSILAKSAKDKNKTIDHILSKANKELKISRAKHDTHLVNMGIAKANAHKSTCYYAIILWPEALRFRRNLNIPNTEFHAHVTLGFDPNDLHKIDKSLSTLLPLDSTQNKIQFNNNHLFEIIQRFSIKKDTQIILNALEILLSNIHSDNLLLTKVLSYRANVFGCNKRFNECLNDSLKISSIDAYHVTALISQAISLLSIKRPLEAAETFRFSEKILNLYMNAKGEQNEAHANKRLLQFFGDKDYENTANLWTQRIQKGLDECRKDTLSVSLSPRIRISITYPINIAYGEIPEHIKWHTTLLPRNFSYVVDGWLCGSSLPKNIEQLKAFEAMNIGLIVTVFDTTLPLLRVHKIKSTNIKYIHLQTLNYKAPRLFEVERYIKEAEECIFIRNKAVLVHCGGGKGRAGCALACFVIKWGLIFDKRITTNGTIAEWKQPQKNASEAIQHIKHVRPGSIETKEQEQFIKQYANHLWTKRVTQQKNDSNINTVNDVDPTGLKRYPSLSDKQIKCLKSKHYPEFVILCGVPGSGKTLFCRLVNSLNKQQTDDTKIKIINEWRIANQDALGKKEKVEMMVNKWLTAKMGAKIGLIIDRCNATKKERKYWMDLSFYIKKTVAVYFDIDAKICKERIHQRKNHPTIQNRSERSINKLMHDFTKNLEIPTKKEGFQAVYIIKNTTDLLSTACEIFGCLPELVRHFIPTKFFKYPRTPHLWNTGAATRDDIQLDAKYTQLYYGTNAKTVTVTEKVDGANLGICINANYEIECQHRGSAIVYNSSCEYTKLKDWLERKSKVLCQILEPQKNILFGEWMQCKHSISYDALPDYFLVFDLYDRYNDTFVSRAKLEHICAGKLTLTKLIRKQIFDTKEEIEALMNKTQSFYTKGAIEGLYLKIDDDEEEINIHRCKLVRSEFIAGINEHWIHKKLQYNTLRIQQYHNDDEEEEKKSEMHVEEVKNVKKNRNKMNFTQRKDDNLYHAIMAKSRFTMNMKVICSKLKLNQDNISSIYVVGSRVWNTANSKSDWDLIIVTKHVCDIAKNKKKAFVSVDNIDAYILDDEQWKNELNENRFICWLTFFLPNEAIWKNNSNICCASIYQIFNGQQFVDALLKDIDKDCKKINKFYAKNKMEKVHKTFVHALRMCKVSKEIITLLKDNACNSWIGIIKFNEIEKLIKEKQIEAQTNKTSNEWIDELRNAAKECCVLV